jgi:predicted esterase
MIRAVSYARTVIFCIVMLPGAGAYASSAGNSGGTGNLKLTFSESGPLSNPDTLLSRMDANGPQADRSWLNRSSLSHVYDVFVPSTYKPQVPHGLFVWTGVAPVPSAWQPVFTRWKLICVSAYEADEQGMHFTPAMPLDAVHNLRKLYCIDQQRIYVSGFSAGAGLASSTLRAFPDVFKGGLFLLGGSFYVVNKTEEGVYEPTLDEYPPSWKGDLATIRKETRIVFMRGGKDPLYEPRVDRPEYDALLMDGFANVGFIVVPGLAHRLPDGAWFDKGIAAMERPYPAAPQTQTDKATRARRILATAMVRVSYLKEYASSKHVTLASAEEKHPSTVTSARKYLVQVVDEYPGTPSAMKAQKVLEQLNDASKSGL